MRFKPGQKVVAAYKSQDPEAVTHWYKPRLGEIVTVKGYSTWPGYIFLFEYYNRVEDGCLPVYAEACFEPLADISELEEILNTNQVTV